MDYTEEQIREIVKELPLIIKEQVMRTYELLIEKGRKEGIEKGSEQKGYTVVANLIQQLGLDDEAAARVAEVSVEFVEKVRASSLSS